MSRNDGQLIFRDLHDLGLAAAERFVELANNAIQTGGRFTVALSGGSTPKVLHKALAEEPFRSQVDWSRTYFFWGDERFVPSDHAESNYRMAYDTLLSRVPVPGENIFPVQTENRTPQDTAADYENRMRIFFQTNAVPRFDLILLGLGEDGHTASLFPFTSALKESIRWVVENYVEKLHGYRITMTVPVMNNAAHVLFLVSGASKAKALKEVLQGPFDPERLPSQFIRPHSGELQFLIDQESASKL